MKWRHRARLALGVFAVVFAVWVAFAFRKREGAPAAPPTTIAQTDPKAVVESTGGKLLRYKGARNEVTVQYEKQLTYANGATKLMGVHVTTEARSGGRGFVIDGNEGEVGDNQSTIKLDGNVRITTSDGLSAQTEHATYVDAEGIVRAPGAVSFAQPRITGSGIGLTYDKNNDVLTILEQAVVNQAADANGAGALAVSAGSAVVDRKAHYIRFERGLHVDRGAEKIEADNGIASLSEDEKHIQSFDLHGGARIGGAGGGTGGLQSMTALDMTLRYAATGDTLQHITAIGDAAIQLAGEGGQAGRRITGKSIDIEFASDGTTPNALVARDSVEATFPGEGGGPARIVRSQVLESSGANGKGLSRARFTGDVQFRERGANVDRAGRSDVLEMALKPGLGSIDEARFTRNAHFEEGQMVASSAMARYVLTTGVLELTGSEPAMPRPHVLTEQITIDANRVDVTLVGPKMKATGDVKSVLQPPKPGSSKTDTKVPSMLKQDQPVNVTGAELNYDGTASRAVYSGGAQLWQGETTVKGTTITIDDKTGDLAATAPVATSTLLEQEDSKTKKTERVRSIGSAKDFKYEDASRLATYTGDAHLSGPQGDLTAARIELYLKPSGDELERAEAYDDVVLRETDRKTSGARLTYFSADERYVVTGSPVTIVDECGRETTGRTVVFLKTAETVTVDGNARNRTTTKGGSACK